MFAGRRYFRKKEYGPILPSISTSNHKSKVEDVDSKECNMPIFSPQKGFYGFAEKDSSELQKIEDSKAENGEIEIICNGIRFRGRPIEEVQLPELVCEECERSLSTIKCEACDQVFCSYCYGICHERSEAGAVLHPHEVEKMVRPIRVGDTSSVIIDDSFKMPNYEFYETDMLQIRNLDNSNSLALSINVETPSSKPCQHTKYRRGDIVVYKHDILKCEVYGKVESEWDFRNGDSAPSLIRGHGGGLVSYIVRCHGIVTPELLRELEQKDDDNSKCNKDGEIDKDRNKRTAALPILEGIESMTLTSERVLANKIDKRLQKAKYNREYGPRHHLNPPVPKGFGGGDNDDESLAGAVDQDSDSESTSGETSKPANSSKGDHSRLASQHLIRTTRPPTVEEMRAKLLPHAIASRRSIDGVVAAYSHISEVEAAFSHQVYDIASEAPLLHRRSMITIQPEDSLVKPIDKLKMIQLLKRENIRRCLTKRLAAMFSNWLLWAFHLWLSKVAAAKQIISFRCAVTIQTFIRRWISQRRLRELINISEVEAKQRWMKVHQKFNYSSREVRGSVTMDNKIYFQNIRDVNLYGKELRLATSKFFNVAARKRMVLLDVSFRKWSFIVSQFKENDLRVTHISGHKIDKGRYVDGIDRAKLVERTRQIHRDLHTSGQLERSEAGDVKVDADPGDDSRLGLASLPMVLHRHIQQGIIEAPPWHPSVGFLQKKLPELPVLPSLVINPNLKCYTSEMQKYNSFRALIEGPTDFSCWIIPGRLAMGKIPGNKARMKGPVDSVIHTHIDSISQILLSGLNTFVSLVAEDEERKVINEDTVLKVDPSFTMPERIKQCHKDVHFALKDHLFALAQMIEDKNIQLEDYSNIEDNSHLKPNSEKWRRSEKMKKERNRLRAKKIVLSREVERVKAAMEAYPASVDWTCHPIEHNTVPSLDLTIPILWKIEQMLWEGKNVYVYSSDGNGRSGLICKYSYHICQTLPTVIEGACLLGRLYGLTHSETLLRMQAYFECQRSQLNRAVVSTCPQLRRQQELVSRILMITNRPYEGSTHRAMLDPESYIVEVEHVRRGLQIESNTKIREDPPEGKYQHKRSLVVANESDKIKRESPVSAIKKRDIILETIDPEMYISSALNLRSLSVIRNVPKYRPEPCDSPAKHHASKRL